MEKYILAIDQGTTSSRAVLFDRFGQLFDMVQIPIPLILRNPGWIEVDAVLIFDTAVQAVKEVLDKNHLDFTSIDSVGITNQRETSVIWDKITGQPVHPAIVWQSNQSASLCEARRDYEETILQKTGLPLNPYFSASKIRFILDNIPHGQARAEKGELLFGTIDTWLLYKLSRGKRHLSDVSNASRTLLFNIHTCQWDEELLRIFNIPVQLLPQVQASSADFGTLECFDTKTPICSLIGDQQASLFGHTCFQPGESKNTYGTGCFLLLNTGTVPKTSQHGLITSIGWQINGQLTYILEGSVFVGGSSVQWLRDQMEMIETLDDSEHCAKESDQRHRVFVVPAFSGLGAPHWDPYTQGAIFGMRRDTTKNDIVRATLESIAYQSKDVFQVMEEDTQMKIHRLYVDGGASKNNYLLQFQADILNIPLLRAPCLEVTALGAAYLAGLQTGFYRDLEQLKSFSAEATIFKPQWSQTKIDTFYRRWKSAVKAAREFK